MSAPAIIDPDLDQAIVELAPVERRIRHVEDLLLDYSIERYPTRLQMLNERADLRQTIRARAEKLNIDPRALQLIVREAEQLRSKARGRQHVPLAKLLVAIGQASERARIEHAELNAEQLAAQERFATATARCAGLLGAIKYLEASRVPA